jgi:hypothetical protein
MNLRRHGKMMAKGMKLMGWHYGERLIDPIQRKIERNQG